MKHFRTTLLLFIAIESQAQGLVEKQKIDNVPSQAQGTGLAQEALTRSFDMRMFDGRVSKKRLKLGDEAVLLQDILIDADILAGPKAEGICQIRLMINDVPLRMSLRQVEGTRGQRPPVQQPELNPLPVGLVTTLTLPSLYRALLEPVGAPVKLDPKDRLTIELSSPSKKTDCSAKVIVSTTT